MSYWNKLEPSGWQLRSSALFTGPTVGAQMHPAEDGRWRVPNLPSVSSHLLPPTVLELELNLDVQYQGAQGVPGGAHQGTCKTSVGEPRPKVKPTEHAAGRTRPRQCIAKIHPARASPVATNTTRPPRSTQIPFPTHRPSSTVHRTSHIVVCTSVHPPNPHPNPNLSPPNPTSIQSQSNPNSNQLEPWLCQTDAPSRAPSTHGTRTPAYSPRSLPGLSC
ncbi:hypothetical protein F4859DRAFT_15913 [Xylaria cf. heliscus]|nr:hypothetical protein F4859DRAFT_15913 [Xylaria cf. heliscus]